MRINMSTLQCMRIRLGLTTLCIFSPVRTNAYDLGVDGGEFVCSIAIKRGRCPSRYSF